MREADWDFGPRPALRGPADAGPFDDDPFAQRQELRAQLADPTRAASLRLHLFDRMASGLASSRAAALETSLFDGPRLAERGVDPRQADRVHRVSDEPESRPSEAPAYWLELLLVDEADEPVRDVRCEIVLPDGTTVTQTSDGAGRVRVDGIAEPGACTVVFSDHERGYWKAD